MGQTFNHEQIIDILSEHLANPFDKRTQGDIAKELDISQSYLSELSTKYKDKINNIADQKRTKYISSIRSRAYKALVSKLEKSDNALKMALQITGDLVERTKSEVEILSPEQKRARLASLLAEATAKGLLPSSLKNTDRTLDVALGQEIIPKPSTDA